VKLTTHLQLVPRSRMYGAILSTPPIRLHGVVLRDNVTFCLITIRCPCTVELFLVTKRHSFKNPYHIMWPIHNTEF